ncbi:MAG: hypothetical protein ACNI28_09750 [Arcobacter sp.]|uniref:hypothetical protein n=1 Tax=Arcobacter sp. TaxID=1872629 RepID=UPI003B005661
MVRLVNTDFKTKEESESFYLNDTFDVSTKFFTYSFFQQYSVYISKYLGNNKLYSLNLLSKKYLASNEILVYVTDEEFIVLFNHKTIYTSKINVHYIIDDMIKCVLITKHILTLLSIDWEETRLLYLVDSNYKYAIENILKENIKINNHIIAKRLGDINQLTKPMNELLDAKKHYLRLTFVASFLVVLIWIMGFGLEMFSQKVFFNTSLDDLRNEVKFQVRTIKREKNLLDKHLLEYKDLNKCISYPDKKVKK